MRTISELQTISDNFLQELIDSAEGKKTSLPFIRHTLSSHPLIKENEIFQVLTIGGTVFKKALVKKNQGELQIVTNEIKPLPLFPTEESLLSFIGNELNPSANKIALNFAYPLTPVFAENRLDGILVSGSKEHRFSGLVGKRICQTIEAYMFNTQHRTVTFACANDTICLLLSGLVSHKQADLAAGIVGTGLNFAIFLDDNSAVNLEAASFSSFPQSEEGRIIDANSIAPGSALFEKEISGAYLHLHFNLLAQKKGLHKQISSTEDLDQLAKNDMSEIGKLAQEVIADSAKLTACAISAMTRFKKRPLSFVMEGSLFWKGYMYKETVSETLKILIPEHHINYVSNQENIFFGTAKLVS